ncbi:response regulator transcription factor [Pelagicoccus enzymogenes]|uniref:response regulator transcription factor n=1 Tax=Pelagicoccus enzymogenes TaxID=2773457 RepID=UPI00281079D9|nr:response regulator transcription factor [Pelagicoccus enzymogenes]MDQ8200632.1 response regulator transcription factor [Pelagicoccus enzymogenes]
MSTEKLSVWLIEDHANYRDTVAMALQARAEIASLLDFSEAESALKRLKSVPSARPDVILIDLGLPGLSGLQAIPKLKDLLPTVNIVVLTVFDDKPKVFEAIASGASGYLLKSSTPGEIVNAVVQVHQGGSPLTPQVARYVLSAFSEVRIQASATKLTQREQEILSYLADGLIKKQVAQKLDISAHTVDYHVRKIYEKLQVNTLSGAISKAVREGLV